MTAAQALDKVKDFPAMEVRRDDDSGVPSAVPASLFIKLFAIMQEMDGVPMSGKHKQGWSFMQSNDVFNGARAAFLKHRVLVIPGVLPNSVLQVEGATSERGNASLRSLCVFTYTFVDVDSGQTYTTTWPGESQDYSDKGIQQSGTSSMKYMLMKMFLATPDHDPDYNTGDEPKQTKPAPQTPATGATPEATKSRPVQNGAARSVPANHAPATNAAEAVTFVSHKVKYIGGGNTAYVKFSDGEHTARLYGRDLLRNLSADFATFADGLQSGPDTQEAVELPAPVRVSAVENISSGGFSYWKATALAVEGGAK